MRKRLGWLVLVACLGGSDLARSAGLNTEDELIAAVDAGDSSGLAGVDRLLPGLDAARAQVLADRLVRYLNDASSDRQVVAALMALGRLGSAASDHAHAIAQQLRSTRSPGNAKVEAADALYRMGTAGLTATIELAQQHSDALPAACTVFDRFGAQAAPAVPLLIRALSDRDHGTYAYDALVKIGAPAVPALAGLLGGPDRISGNRAEGALVQIGEPSVAALTEALGDPLRRGVALTALQRIGPAAAASAAAIADYIGDDRLSAAAKRTLLTIGPASCEALIPLVATSDIRSDIAIDLLNEFATQCPPSGAIGLEPALAGNDGERTARVAAIVLRMQAGHAGALHVLDGLLVSGDVEQRLGALRNIAAAGAGAAALAARAAKLMQDPSVQVRIAAATALGAIGPPAASQVPALLRAISDPLPGEPTRDAPLPTEMLQSAALDALGKIGPGAAAAVPEVIKRLEDPAWLEPQWRDVQNIVGDIVMVDRVVVSDRGGASLRALQGIGHKAKAANAIVAKIAESAAADLRLQAVRTLGAIGEPREQAERDDSPSKRLLRRLFAAAPDHPPGTPEELEKLREAAFEAWLKLDATSPVPRELLTIDDNLVMLATVASNDSRRAADIADVRALLRLAAEADGRRDLWAAAIAALGAANAAGESALPMLIETAVERAADVDARAASSAAIKRIDPDGDKVMRLLKPRIRQYPTECIALLEYIDSPATNEQARELRHWLDRVDGT